MREFRHPRIGEEVCAVGGRYVFMKEVRLAFEGEQVLYLLGAARADSSCCGLGGTAFAAVAGFIRRWHCGRTPQGDAVSEVEPIEREDQREALRRRIMAAERVPQVNYI